MKKLLVLGSLCFMASSALSANTLNTPLSDTDEAISSNSKSIIQLNSDVRDLRTALEKQAKRMDGAYAVGAAFAGLVDPYGIGNTSMSFATGYHGDAHAVAFGVGSRINEIVTVKTGGAFEDGTNDLTAFAGIGFEF